MEHQAVPSQKRKSKVKHPLAPSFASQFNHVFVAEGASLLFFVKAMCTGCEIEIPFDILCEILGFYLKLSVKVRDFVGCGVNSSMVFDGRALFLWGRDHTPKDKSYIARGVQKSHLTNILVLSKGYGRHHFALTKTGLYGWGQNNYKQISGAYFQCDSPTEDDLRRIKSFDYSSPFQVVLPTYDIKAICTSNSFTVVVTNCGKAYVWGQIMGDYKVRQVVIPHLPNVLFEAAAATEHDALLVTRDGNVYKLNDNPDPLEVKFEDDIKIVAVACGMEHYMALSSVGSVLMWGENAFSQLGIGREDKSLRHTGDRKVVVKLYSEMKIAAINCGGYQSMVVCENGDLYIAGANFHGQLGLDDTERRYIPLLHPHVSNVLAIASGHRHSVSITKEGVVVFGSDSSGQLGRYGKGVNKPFTLNLEGELEKSIQKAREVSERVRAEELEMMRRFQDEEAALTFALDHGGRKDNH